MTNVTVAFRNFENAPKEGFIIRKYITHKIKIINSLKAECVLLQGMVQFVPHRKISPSPLQ